MGHLNVRHYVAMFDDASFQLLGRIAGREMDAKLGWADVRMEIAYKHETPLGKLVTIRSRVEKRRHVVADLPSPDARYP